MDFEIRLAGAVALHTADGHTHTLGRPKTRLALAILAWEASRSVSVDRLIHRLWGSSPPAKPRDALHAHISHIRALLRPAGPDAPPLTSGGSSYTLGVDPDRVDLRRYVALVDRARSLAEIRDEAGALRLFREADRYAAEEPLTGITADWADHLRGLVAEKRLAAATVRGGILLSGGRYDEAIPLLMALAEDFPTDEGLAERLALALHGSGRTAEAAQLLRETIRLAGDTGVDTGARLRRVQQGILSGAAAGDLLRAQQGTPGPPTPARHVPDNVPRDVPWVGREDELRRLTEALTEGGGGSTPRVTVEALDGMGGIGKTSLAVHAAHLLRDRFPDGRIYLHLRGHTPQSGPLPAARALADLLRLIDGTARLPDDLDELVALWRTTVRDRRMLVILDDAAGPGQVRPLLPGASPTAVIVTSRRRLVGLPGVRPITLDTLPRDDAIALFNHRFGARRAPQTLRFTDLTELVRLSAYLPLAVELLASRLLTHPSWDTSDLLRQLRDEDGRLAEMRDGERSLSGVFALSVRSLSPAQRLVFRRVALHFGSEFDTYAAAALAELPFGETERILEELLLLSLLREPSPHRFSSHDLLRAYGRTLPPTSDAAGDAAGRGGGAGAAQERRKAVARLANHYLSVADRADRLLHPFRVRITAPAGPPVAAWPEFADVSAAGRWFTDEGRNLLGTLDWLEHNAAAGEFAIAIHMLAGFLDLQGHFPTSGPLLRRAIAHWRAVGNAPALGRALLDLVSACTHAGRYDEAGAAARESLELAERLSDSALEKEALYALAGTHWYTGGYLESLPLLEKALALSTQSDDLLYRARIQNLVGVINLHRGRPEIALSAFQQALSDFTDADDLRGRYMALNNIAQHAERTGDNEAAVHAIREAIDIAEQLNRKGEVATMKMNLANVLTTLGKADEALKISRRSVLELRAVGDVRAEALALNAVGQALRALDRAEEALPYHATALEMIRRVHAVGEEILVLLAQAAAERDTGRLNGAAGHLHLALDTAERIGARREETLARKALGELSGFQGSVGDGQENAVKGRRRGPA